MTPIDSAATDEILTNIAVDLLLAMMASASTDVISPKDWWTRARTALETSASVASNWPEMVSRFGAKLQIVALSERSAKSIASLGKDIATNNAFRRFRAICRRDALYITAMARMTREEQKASMK